jgi:hypothetical protein
MRISLAALALLLVASCSSDPPARVMHCDGVDALSKCYEYASTSLWADGKLCSDSRGTQREGSCPSAQIVGRCFDKDEPAPAGSLGDTIVAEIALKKSAAIPTFYARGAYPYTKETAAKDCDGVLR